MDTFTVLKIKVKNFKKVVDKQNQSCYTIKVACREMSDFETYSAKLKRRKRKGKKYLTRAEKFGRIIKLSLKRGIETVP